MSKKIKHKEIILDLYNDDRVVKTNHKFKYKKHMLEVVLVDNTEYEVSLQNQEVSSMYLFSESGKYHVLIITEKHYSKTFKDLYTPPIILKNLKFFVNKKHVMNYGRITLALALLSLVAINLMFIFQYGLRQIFYIPIISVGVGLVVFLLFGKLLKRQYAQLQKELMEELILEYPEIERRIEQEKKLFK